MNRGGAAGDVRAVDEQHEHEVDAVAMQAFGRRQSFVARQRFDAELVDFDLPLRNVRRQPAKQRASELEDRAERMSAADLGRDRREPARDAAVQRVVVEALIVRLVRLPIDRAVASGRKHGVPAAPIASPVGHVLVELEVVPAAGERIPVVERAKWLERPPHALGAHEDEAVLRQRLLQRPIRQNGGGAHRMILPEGTRSPW